MDEAWQPIETAPKDGTPILVCTAGGNYWPDKVLWQDGFWVVPPKNELILTEASLTHWMPLPEPPK